MPPERTTLDGLEKKIRAVERCGERYTPTQREWDRASRFQRRRMTWPDHIIDWIRRTG